MSFLSDIFDAVKRKQAELKDRREFLDMVESQAKPIRRAAYMKQMLSEVVAEGIEKAKEDSLKKANKAKQPQDFGIGKGLEDPYKYINPKEKKWTQKYY